MERNMPKRSEKILRTFTCFLLLPTLALQYYQHLSKGNNTNLIAGISNTWFKVLIIDFIWSCLYTIWPKKRKSTTVNSQKCCIQEAGCRIQWIIINCFLPQSQEQKPNSTPKRRRNQVFDPSFLKYYPMVNSGNKFYVLQQSLFKKMTEADFYRS